MTASRNAITTIALSAFALILGVSAAVAAILFNHTWVPNVILGTKTVKSGLNNATTVLEFGLLSSPNDAVYASGLISMTSTVLIVAGLVVIRHFARHNIWGWLAFGPAFLNLLGTVGSCAAAYLLKSQYPRATSTDQIQYNNGVYDTGGKLYTREGWACSMNALYADREGHWAKKACSNFVCGYYGAGELLDLANNISGNCQTSNPAHCWLRSMSVCRGLLADISAWRVWVAVRTQR